MNGEPSVPPMKSSEPAESASSRPAPPTKVPFHRRHRKKLLALGFAVLAPPVTHGAIVLGTRIHPPPLVAHVDHTLSVRDGVRWSGDSYARKRGAILEVRLVGSPETLGYDHSTLLYDEMVGSEGQLYATLNELVPVAPLRWLLFDVARVLHRDADLQMSSDRKREIAAQAARFSPDPFASYFPTYQRLIYLNSLYDIALGFEHSPMLGCSSFVVTGSKSQGGHTLLARNFDFEVGEVYDKGKVVFLVFEEGKIPFASVAWPGLVGVLSGMNREGLSVVVHGGRARQTQAEGEPVVHTTRALLSEARTVDEAVALLATREPMVSHILLLADATGDKAVVERAPGAPNFVRRSETDVLAVTNHFEGPLSEDPKNERVRRATSTLPRRARLDELLDAPGPFSVSGAVDVLRDKHGVGGVSLPLGDRTTLDAVIATHAVVMDSTSKELWVSEGPHLMGRFLRFDLKALLDPSYVPEGQAQGQAKGASIGEDPAFSSGEFGRWLEEGAPHSGVE